MLMYCNQNHTTQGNGNCYQSKKPLFLNLQKPMLSMFHFISPILHANRYTLNKSGLIKFILEYKIHDTNSFFLNEQF